MFQRIVSILTTASGVFVFATAEAADTIPSDATSAYFRLLWGLLVVLGLLLVIYAAVKKRFSLFAGNAHNVIKVLEIKPLQPKKSLCLIEVHGRQYLLGLGGDQITLLADLTRQSSTSFDEVLKASTPSQTL